MAIYDTMQFVTPDVGTICMGLGASMGQFLLCAGAPGKRFALPHARIMMHQPSGGVRGQARDIAIQAEQMIYIKRLMAERIAYHTGQTVEQIEEDSERDRWFTAEQAKEYGIIDHVISRRAARCSSSSARPGRRRSPLGVVVVEARTVAGVVGRRRRRAADREQLASLRGVASAGTRGAVVGGSSSTALERSPAPWSVDRAADVVADRRRRRRPSRSPATRSAPRSASSVVERRLGRRWSRASPAAEVADRRLGVAAAARRTPRRCRRRREQRRASAAPSDAEPRPTHSPAGAPCVSSSPTRGGLGAGPQVGHGVLEALGVAEQALPATSTLAPAAAAPAIVRGRCRRRPRCRRRRPPLDDQAPHLGDLRLHRGDVGLAAEARG